MEILNARPYAFLDDAPLEERRTQAVLGRRWLDEETATAFGSLDAAAIERVRGEAWPEAENDDEMHDALQSLGFVGDDEARSHAGWPRLLEALARARRATRVVRAADAAPGFWVAAERLPQFEAVHRARSASLRSTHPGSSRAVHGRARTRSARSCAAGSNASDL